MHNINDNIPQKTPWHVNSRHAVSWHVTQCSYSLLSLFTATTSGNNKDCIWAFTSASSAQCQCCIRSPTNTLQHNTLTSVDHFSRTHKVCWSPQRHQSGTFLTLPTVYTIHINDFLICMLFKDITCAFSQWLCILFCTIVYLRADCLFFIKA